MQLTLNASIHIAAMVHEMRAHFSPSTKAIIARPTPYYIEKDRRTVPHDSIQFICFSKGDMPDAIAHYRQLQYRYENPVLFIARDDAAITDFWAFPAAYSGDDPLPMKWNKEAAT